MPPPPPPPASPWVGWAGVGGDGRGWVGGCLGGGSGAAAAAWRATQPRLKRLTESQTYPERLGEAVRCMRYSTDMTHSSTQHTGRARTHGAQQQHPPHPIPTRTAPAALCRRLPPPPPPAPPAVGPPRRADPPAAGRGGGGAARGRGAGCRRTEGGGGLGGVGWGRRAMHWVGRMRGRPTAPAPPPLGSPPTPPQHQAPPPSPPTPPPPHLPVLLRQGHHGLGVPGQGGREGVPAGFGTLHALTSYGHNGFGTTCIYITWKRIPFASNDMKCCPSGWYLFGRGQGGELGAGGGGGREEGGER